MFAAVGGRLTAVIALAELFARLDSSVVVATIATLVRKPPPTVGVTIIVSVTVALLTVPKLQTTVPPMLVHPGEADTKVTLAGKVSVTVTLAACAEVRLVTLRV